VQSAAAHWRRCAAGAVLGEIEGHAPVVLAQAAAAHPHDLAGRRQGVEVRVVIARHARGEDVGLEGRRRHRHALQPLDRFEQDLGRHAVGVGVRHLVMDLARYAVPGHEQTGQRGGSEGSTCRLQRASEP